MKKIILTLTIFFGFLSFFSPAVFAQSERDAVLVNPIRGKDFWTQNYTLTETPQKQYETLSKNKFPASWLVRFDALTDQSVQDFLKKLDSTQDIGLFFEITPTLTQSAGVKYNESQNWHFSKSVLLTGYSPEDRIKLIDTVFGKYKEIFGNYPKSVGAWWIDAYSLQYMKDKYKITANLDVADQYSTDGYQVWGQYWSTPFYPSKQNALMPAQSESQKIGVVTMQWATRDPLNGYGNGVFESTYSVQANDYILHDLKTDYFEKLLNIYPQTTVGIENDFNFAQFGNEYNSQIETIARLKKEGKIAVSNMAEYAQIYSKQNPGVSPQVIISASDPLGGQGKVVWFMNTKYRAGLFFGADGVTMRDLRFYNDSNKEDCFDKACDELKLAFSQTSAIDQGNFNSKWVIDDSPAEDINIKSLQDSVEIKYKTLAGIEKSITFLPNDLKINDKVYTVPVAVMNALADQKKEQPESSFTSEIDLKKAIMDMLPETGKFIILVILFFVIPGLLFSRKLSIAVVSGFVLFTVVSFLLGFLSKINPIFLSVNWLWLIPIISFILSVKKYPLVLEEYKIIRPNIKRVSLLGLIFIGSVSWMLVTVKNGLMFNYGYGFWGPNGHDIIWHLSLISELQKNFPPQNPIFGGVSLNNYHYFYDLLIARSASLMNVNVLDLVFRFFPLLISVLSGVLMYKLTYKISKSFTAGFWSVFFLYFGGSFGWIVSYFRDKSFGGETMFWGQQSISTLLNPPFAISLLIMLAGLYIYYAEKEKFSKIGIISMVLLFGSLIEFKAYGGLLILGALFLVSIGKVIKKDFSYLLLFFLTALFSAIVFLPNNSGSESLIEFLPLWLVTSMITSEDRLNWYRLTITLQSGVLYKVILANIIGIVIFIFGNLGTRLIGLFSIKELFREKILFYILIFSVVLPLIFIQKGNSWNIIQFFYYGLFVMAVFSGIFMAKVFEKLPKILAVAIGLTIVLLTVLTTWNTLGQYLPKRPPAKLSVKEIDGLNFLKSQTNGIVLSYPYEDKYKSYFETPLPLEAYTSTAYVSAFSGKDGFIEDTINLEILGIDYRSRLNIAKEIFRNHNASKDLLAKNNIKYVYLPKGLKIELDPEKMGLKNIYENEEVRIYKVN